VLVDRRHCTNIFDIRSLRRAYIESDHYLVCAKMKMKIKKSEKIKRSEMSKWNINKLMDEGVKEEFIEELTVNLRNTTPEEKGNINGRPIWNKITKLFRNGRWPDMATFQLTETLTSIPCYLQMIRYSWPNLKMIYNIQYTI
jgi:hypothetical protein